MSDSVSSLNGINAAVLFIGSFAMMLAAERMLGAAGLLGFLYILFVFLGLLFSPKCEF
ncbi:hypothetical protein SAMN04487895_101279 [Paenibacillus sophorae]|uniref:Uncharacterized protein n=1 Tax=Paenibacillus sophorae TaxID=1333845 RepID=A0A1H8FYH8_9BACL|nr:hypothetical protein [Paenibacillus sophorae]QWU18565.1 hypothetical protein KP014_18950 [Paenibacillus sophorae]SEN36158.1 hypothetical protein SAMN04487895_101279 [Paenibacillus sophorae]